MSVPGPVYLDHAATTPMRPEAIEAMTAVLASVGNASSLHGAGRVARRRLEESHEWPRRALQRCAGYSVIVSPMLSMLSMFSMLSSTN